MSEQIRVGVIGGGNMGKHHARNYHEMPEVELVGIADPNQQIADMAAAYQTKYYELYEGLLDEAEPEAVSIAVPTPLHYLVAKETLSRGINTLVEKPIASRLEEADELIELSKETGAVFTVGHIERYNPVVAKLKEAIDNGRLGTISSIISQRLGGFPRIEPKTDVVTDLAVHDIDIFNYLLGTSGELLAAHGSQTFHETETDSAEILMNYGGISGFIQANWVTPVKVRRITITGSKGYAEANYLTQEITFYDRTIMGSADNFSEFIDRYGEPHRQTIKTEPLEPLRRELTAFISAAAGSTDEENYLVSPEDAKIALRIAMAAVRSLKQRYHGS